MCPYGGWRHLCFRCGSQGWGAAGGIFVFGELLVSDDIEALNRSLSKALEEFDQINYNALLCGGEELRHLKPLVPETSH